MTPRTHKIVPGYINEEELVRDAESMRTQVIGVAFAQFLDRFRARRERTVRQFDAAHCVATSTPRAGI